MKLYFSFHIVVKGLHKFSPLDSKQYDRKPLELTTSACFQLGAAAVNLVAGEKPADVYSGIAAR